MSMCARETANVWFLMRTRYGRRRLLSYKFWRYVGKPYAWGDSVGQYLNRWFVCPLFGHRKVQPIYDYPDNGGEKVVKFLHCFCCGRQVEGPYEGPVTKLATAKFKNRC